MSKMDEILQHCITHTRARIRIL